jgi:hypothetical protein
MHTLFLASKNKDVKPNINCPGLSSLSRLSAWIRTKWKPSGKNEEFARLLMNRPFLADDLEPLAFAAHESVMVFQPLSLCASPGIAGGISVFRLIGEVPFLKKNKGR